MIDARIMLAVATVISIGLLLNGLRFSRMDRNPWAGKSVSGMPVQGSDMSVDKVNRIGRLQMFAAPIFFLIFAAICFGLLGPAEGIKTISLN